MRPFLSGGGSGQRCFSKAGQRCSSTSTTAQPNQQYFTPRTKEWNRRRRVSALRLAVACIKSQHVKVYIDFVQDARSLSQTMGAMSASWHHQRADEQRIKFCAETLDHRTHCTHTGTHRVDFFSRVEACMHDYRSPAHHVCENRASESTLQRDFPSWVHKKDSNETIIHHADFRAGR